MVDLRPSILVLLFNGFERHAVTPGHADIHIGTMNASGYDHYSACLLCNVHRQYRLMGLGKIADAPVLFRLHNCGLSLSYTCLLLLSRSTGESSLFVRPS